MNKLGHYKCYWSWGEFVEHLSQT